MICSYLFYTGDIVLLLLNRLSRESQYSQSSNNSITCIYVDLIPVDSIHEKPAKLKKWTIFFGGHPKQQN
jgi:hypothetical protein